MVNSQRRFWEHALLRTNMKPEKGAIKEDAGLWRTVFRFYASLLEHTLLEHLSVREPTICDFRLLQ